ncbi:sulfotransferase 1E1-like [Argiope bruennichi]|uniref:Sulfotransferase 1E1 like protein n=1 Tax=Argiope bruennichi TaxID=94029 RepID=A0A8T0EU43_ARGBR|nr:sulfotransferase 1E1-like [Argiope bruennichi]KAF8781773.1 Sulfotransferase 1E1 like protein [Argiope bruennichi]
MTAKFQFSTLPKDEKLAESFDVYLCNEFSLPSFAIKFIKEEYSTYEARSDDIYVVSYPKTGTTWLQEIVYLIHSNVDINSARNLSLDKRFPYIEHSKTNFNEVKNMNSPRLLKTHLPYSCLPEDILQKQCKMIYITRNPRDVAVSYYHFACMLKETQYKGNFEQFFQRFLLDRTTYSPFLLHNLEFWNHRNDKNVLFLFYEDLKRDITSNLKKIAEFLDRNLSDEELNSIKKHTEFKSMAKQESVVLPEDATVGSKGSFFRKGQTGDWKNYFTPDMIQKLDIKINEMLKDTGLQYTYEL